MRKAAASGPGFAKGFRLRPLGYAGTRRRGKPSRQPSRLGRAAGYATAAPPCRRVPGWHQTDSGFGRKMRLACYGSKGTDDLASSRTISGCGLVRVLLGILLLAATGLKAHQLATEPVAERDLLSNRTFLVVWVELELLLGTWFVSGILPRAAWVAAMNCFFLFAIVAALKAVSGEASCGCFGRVEVSPWYTLGLDAGALAALLVFRPDLRAPLPVSHRRLRGGLAAAFVLAAGVPVAILAARYEPAMLTPQGEIVGDESVVLLEPETWVGQPCPILSHIDIGRELARGQWIVVLYHHDCPHCQERVPEFDREARVEAARARHRVRSRNV